MDKLEYLNSFFIERLMSVAGEIFEAVQDTVSAYEEEVKRTKLENQRLKKILCEVQERKTAASADVEPCHADGTLPEQKSNQGPMNSDPSVLQLMLKMATMKKGDDHISETVPEEVTKISQEQPDAKPSIIQVKVELSTVHQDAQSQALLNNPSSSSSPSSAVACNKEPPHHYCRKPVNEQVDSGPHNSSGVTIKLEPMDSEVVCTNNANITESEIIAKNYLEAFQDDQATSSSQSNMPLDHSSAETRFQSQAVQRFMCCDYCKKPFGNFRQLKQHMVEHRKDRPKPYRCEFCGKCFSYSQVLETHRRTHTGERPFPCKFCGRRFNQNSHLKDHEKIHTGERPFSCSICGKRYIRKSQVKKHCHIHHQVVQQ